MGRRPCCSRVGLKKSTWSRQEDTILINYINTHGAGHWRDFPEKAGLKRCGKSCRFRWLNYLRPDIKRGGISSDEEELIIRLHRLLGNRWSLIAGRLPGRTDNEIKNHWNTMLRKRVENDDIVEKKNKAVRPKAIRCIRFINIPHQQEHHSHDHNNNFINDQHTLDHHHNMGLEQDGPSSNVVNLHNSLNPWNYHNFTDHVLKSSGESYEEFGEFNGFNDNSIDGNYFGEVNGHNLTNLQSMEGSDFSSLASFLSLGDEDWVLPPYCK